MHFLFIVSTDTNAIQMGKMKEMFIIMKDDGMKDLDTLIKKAVRLNADRINFRGTVYTVQKAKQIRYSLRNQRIRYFLTRCDI